MILGGTWRTPVAVGLQSKTFITDQKNEGTYNEASFEREYESKWSGTVEDAFFNGEHFFISNVFTVNFSHFLNLVMMEGVPSIIS